MRVVGLAELLLTTMVAAVVSAPVGPTPAENAATRCTDPAHVLDLTNWKVTLPTSAADTGRGPLEVTQPALAGYQAAPWFEVAPGCDAVLFRAAVDGVTTKGSKNPRSELREMTRNGSDTASWSSTVGTHTLVVSEAFVHLPRVKPDLVGAQIHDADDDITVFRLEGTNLYVTEGNDNHHTLVTGSYVLGTRFEAKYVVHGGDIEVYYDGALQTTISRRFSGAYFKAGAYTQANCSNSAPCEAGNYGETAIYAVAATHQIGRWDQVRDWATYDLPIGLGVVLLIMLGYLSVRRVRRR